MNRSVVAIAVTALAVPLAGCATGAAGRADGVSVTASDTACALSTATVPSGATTFTVKNTGSTVTEFYVLDAKRRIVGEVENVGPGLTRTLTLHAAAGTYTTECKPGMTGEGVGRTTLTVTGTGAAAETSDARLVAATTRYRDYVRSETAQLLAETKRFAGTVTSGDDASARRRYVEARAHWERIEPVAESFGTLDAKLDARRADVPSGTPWTGWHRFEHDLWGGRDVPRLTASARRTEADRLVSLTTGLLTRVRSAAYAPKADAVANGAIELLDEVASTKITGEEETYSHTDLVDFAANVEGAKAAYGVLRATAQTSDRALATQLDQRFAALEARLARHGSLERGFPSYRTLSAADVKGLSDAVNALAEPLSRLTRTVLA